MRNRDSLTWLQWCWREGAGFRNVLQVEPRGLVMHRVLSRGSSVKTGRMEVLSTGLGKAVGARSGGKGGSRISAGWV